MRKIYRIFIQPLPRLDGVGKLSEFIEKQTEWSIQKNFSVTNLDFTYINDHLEDTKNVFFYDLLIAALSIRKKAKPNDQVFIYFRSLVNRSGIKTSWASFITPKQILFFAKLFEGDYKVDFIFDLPNKTFPENSVVFRNSFEELIKSDELFFNNDELTRFTNNIVKYSQAKGRKIKTLTNLIMRVNEIEIPLVEVCLNFYDKIKEDYPLTKYYFEHETTDFSCVPYEIKVF